jgi:hypothetical protein
MENDALQKLLEAVDLLGMVDDLTNPANFERISGSSLAGIRITLKHVRQLVLETRKELAGKPAEKPAETPGANAAAQTRIEVLNMAMSPAPEAAPPAPKPPAPPPQIHREVATVGNQTNRRKDFRSSLEQLIDRQ